MSLLALAVLKYLFLGLLYAFLVLSLVTMGRDVLARSSSHQHGARLVGVEGGYSGRAFELSPVTTIGRSEHNALVLEDKYTSHSHALIFRNGEGFVIQDAGSSNGTYVNGEIISQPTPLRKGDIIRIGKSSFKFDEETN